MTLGDILDRRPSAWPSRHPSGAPYFLEYLPLLKLRGGVNHFDRRIPRIFFPHNGKLSQEEIVYLASLIDHTEKRGLVAVFTAPNSLARVGEIAAQFGGRHILVHRNFYDQWLSYLAMDATKTNFVNQVPSFMRAENRPPFFDRIEKLLPLTGHYAHDLNWFCLFLVQQAFVHVIAYDHVDTRINTTRLASSDDYRRSVEIEVCTLSGLKIDLKDARETSHKVSHLDGTADIIRERIYPLLADLPGSDDARAFAMGKLEDALARLDGSKGVSGNPASVATTC
jgi:hypothetical protein